MAEQTLNIPQILAFLLIAYLTIRWLRKPSSSTPASAPQYRQTPDLMARVDDLSAMFPQHDRRTLAWAIQQNRGGPAAIAERILAGHTLERPPPTFLPNLTERAPTTTQPAAQKSAKPDLITRYNLKAKVDAAGEVPSEEGTKKWSQDKEERKKSLAKRREEMILAARRRLVQQDQGSPSA
ncbi:hypothetical protein M011DRAFT_476172 [Sporormia fimetaria CBS 119925]|uniref:CUE domain-containing protein n=1 Tax=Sporormia fimetaria CBS 119925 TaxID=1340428 RepID=A0A6A6VG64_9PLEO|nr:hypothetical protein M011DRAFT_476172 [Sporormia fimetaria CBS 119925]